VQTADRQTAVADDDLLEFLAGRGFKREEARAWLSQRGMGLDNDRWTEIRKRARAGAVPAAGADGVI